MNLVRVIPGKNQMQTKEQKRIWRQNNKHKNNEYQRKWRVTHPQKALEKARECNKTYYEKNKNKIKQRTFIRYHTRNKKPLSEAQRECLRMAIEYDKNRHVSSYSHSDKD